MTKDDATRIAAEAVMLGRLTGLTLTANAMQHGNSDNYSVFVEDAPPQGDAPLGDGVSVLTRDA